MRNTSLWPPGSRQSRKACLWLQWAPSEPWPRLTAAALQICWRGQVFLRANVEAVGGHCSVNSFLVKLRPVIYLAACSALRKTSQSCYGRRESCKSVWRKRAWRNFIYKDPNPLYSSLKETEKVRWCVAFPSHLVEVVLVFFSPFSTATPLNKRKSQEDDGLIINSCFRWIHSMCDIFGFIIVLIFYFVFLVLMRILCLSRCFGESCKTFSSCEGSIMLCGKQTDPLHEIMRKFWELLNQFGC